MKVKPKPGYRTQELHLCDIALGLRLPHGNRFVMPQVILAIYLCDVEPLFVDDKPNPFLTQVFSQFDQLTKPGDNFTLAALDPSSLHVRNSNVFRYSGSLTTEPFTEGVEWNVLQKVHTLSKAQLKQWSNVINLPNARELQALNGRVVTLLTKDHSVC
ncbi:hypothetical protein DYB38_011503 [Aphanomyces astaci]|uniref:Alpha-carbonic anhydrase domain-containing protein n=1 Tax=Aphanomyces astaci TaxID=112090 RepID=A0A397C1X7_APHAT|nr:hypothetical protein DYB38_011503 [Aphanomyces astaci]